MTQKRKPCDLIAIALFAIAAGVTATSVGKLAVAQEEIPGLIKSIHLSPEYAFASTSDGIYRASLKEKQWQRLPLNDKVPLGGQFAKEPPDSVTLLYFTSTELVPSSTLAGGKSHGLYKFDSEGKNCKLLSTDHDFKNVYVHRDKTVYAITINTEEKDGKNYYSDRVIESDDSGKTWNDISHGDAFGLRLITFFPDPDHQDLVCLLGNDLRSEVLQASNREYQWTETREFDWNKKHETDESFFASTASAGHILYEYRATLSNYFSYNFGGETSVFSLQAMPKAPADSYQPGQKIELPVEVKFLTNGDNSIVLPDCDNSTALWYLKRITPEGKREMVINTAARDPKSLKPTAHELKTFGSYRRSIDLTSLADFSIPGTYRVQLIYNNYHIADQNRGQWPGAFSTEPFEIKISR